MFRRISVEKNVETYIKENVEYYSLFCRMGSMRKRFSEMSFEKIEQEKRKLVFGN